MISGSGQGTFRASGGKLQNKTREGENPALRVAAGPLEKTNPLWRPANGNKGVASRRQSIFGRKPISPAGRYPTGKCEHQLRKSKKRTQYGQNAKKTNAFRPFESTWRACAVRVFRKNPIPDGGIRLLGADIPARTRFMFFAKETCMSAASQRFSPSSTENAAFRRCLATRKNEPTLETSERKQGLAPRRQSIFGRTKAATHYQTKPSQPEKNWQSVPAPLPNET